MTVKQLRTLARQQKVRGYSRMNKAALEAALGHVAAAAPTVKELRAEAKRHGLKGYSRLRKAQLVALLAGARREQSTLDGIINKYADLPQGAPAVMDPTEAILRTMRQWSSNEQVNRAMQRLVWGGGLPADHRLLHARQLRAIDELANNASTDAEHRYWRQMYAVEAQRSV